MDVHSFTLEATLAFYECVLLHAFEDGKFLNFWTQTGVIHTHTHKNSLSLSKKRSKSVFLNSEQTSTYCITCMYW